MMDRCDSVDDEMGVEGWAMMLVLMMRIRDTSSLMMASRHLGLELPPQQLAGLVLGQALHEHAALLQPLVGRHPLGHVVHDALLLHLQGVCFTGPPY